jgi:hypothetical protein
MPMRRAAAAVLAASGLVIAPGAAAQLRPGEPAHVRVARPADALPRSAARFEEWTVTLADPRSRGRITFRVVRTPDNRDAELIVSDGRESTLAELGAHPAPRRRLAWRLQDGTASLTRRAGGWRLRVDAPLGSARVDLRRARPGVTAGRWHLGREAGAGPLRLSWSAPVATSVVSGRVRALSRSVRLRRWRGSIEHRWGFFDHGWTAWDLETTAAVHGPGGSAWLLHGANRRDFLTGPGARDAFWLGVLVRVTRAGTRWCRPAMRRRSWLVGIDGPVAARRTRAACAGRTVRLRRLDETADYRGGINWQENTARAAAAPRGAAWIRYAARQW